MDFGDYCFTERCYLISNNSCYTRKISYMKRMPSISSTTSPEISIASDVSISNSSSSLYGSIESSLLHDEMAELEVI